MDTNKARLLLEGLKKVSFKELEDQLGVKVSIGRATFGSSYLNVTLEAKEVTTDGSVSGKEAEAFKTLATLYGLSATDLGRTFHSGGKAYKIVGLLSRARRCPILAEGENGQRYKFPAESVAVALGVKPRAFLSRQGLPSLGERP